MLTSCVPAQPQPPLELPGAFKDCSIHNQLRFYNVFTAYRQMTFTEKWALQLELHTIRDLLKR